MAAIVLMVLWAVCVAGVNEPVTTESEIANFTGTVPWIPDYGPASYVTGDPEGEARYVLGKRFFMNDGNWNLQTISGAHFVEHYQLSRKLYKRVAVQTSGFRDGPPSEAQFNNPIGVWYHTNSTGAAIIYVADCNNHAIRAIHPTTGMTTTLAGNGQPGRIDNTNRLASTFKYPRALVTDNSGILYVADTNNHLIRRIDPSGGVTTLVGDYQGYADGVGTAAFFNYPAGLAISADGVLWVSDSNNHCIRRVDAATRTVTTFAGSPEPGWKDEFGPYARLHSPTGITVHLASNDLYVADSGNQKIRRIDEFGTVTTIGGSVLGDSDGWDQDSLRAKLNNPHGITVAQHPPTGWASAGYYKVFPAVYFADKFNNRVRALHNHWYSPGEQFFNNIARPSWNCTSVIGSVPGYKDSNSTRSQMFEPAGMVLTPDGELIVADSRNNVIRKITLLDQHQPTCDNVKERCNVQRDCLNQNQDVCVYRPNPCLADDTCYCDVLFTTASCGLSRRSGEL